MIGIDSLNALADAVLQRSHDNLCCLERIHFSGFIPAQDSVMVAGQFRGVTTAGEYWYKNVVVTLEDLQLIDTTKFIEYRLEAAHKELVDLVECECFDYWVRKVRREAGLSDSGEDV